MRRRLAAALLLGGVTAVHLELAGALFAPRLGEGAADAPPQRIAVAFTRTLAPTAPPVATGAARPPARRRAAPSPPAVAAAPPPPAASAAAPEVDSAASAPASEATAVAAAQPDVPPANAETPASAASMPAPSAAPTFEWPPSTRLSYTLNGHFRGPVEGQARVEWLRSGSRYQVHLDISVGPSFAPLVQRRISSEGEITEAGLQPRRYDEETRVVLRDVRRNAIAFDAQTLRLPDGRTLPRPPGVQDTASQFVQLTWLFTLDPALLAVGRSVEIPLALPRYVDTWTYDVVARETLHTPAGAVDTLQVKPRREPRPGLDLTAELWVAPSLQNLPVRIFIRHDRETWIDLLIDQLPQQAAAPPERSARL